MLLIKVKSHNSKKDKKKMLKKENWSDTYYFQVLLYTGYTYIYVGILVYIGTI